MTGNPRTWTYRFDQAGSDTRLTLTVDYDLPQNQLARFAAAGVLDNNVTGRGKSSPT